MVLNPPNTVSMPVELLNTEATSRVAYDKVSSSFNTNSKVVYSLIKYTLGIGAIWLGTERGGHEFDPLRSSNTFKNGSLSPSFVPRR